ncbi:serine hydrolase [Streptomyces sp. I05A-00742]|uniref:serine hydrolase domain-containing protein n=1 Tax=Streptomyces sp. I05A-00742 TaxID=2732853 RepID=UPI002017E3EE|nr:serine hydrolase domain-containing protein [Streptomyces sp. I05A-00742]
METKTGKRRGAWTAVAAAMVTVVGMGGAAQASAASPLDRQALRESLEGLPEDDVTGALVRVAGADGHWWGTTGVADRATGERVRADAAFRIGGISKLFTGTVVLQLAGERQVDLVSPVRHYLPDLVPDTYDGVTVGMLLDHTSGFPAPPSAVLTGDGSNEWYAGHRRDHWAPEEIVRLSMKGQRLSDPGRRQQYNGVNSYVAGLLVERVTGRSLAHEIRARIVRPLGLGRTYLPAADDTSLAGRHTHGYLQVTEKDSSGVPRTVLEDVTEQSPSPWAEGGMVSTAADLDRFLDALLAGRLLRPAQQELLFRLPGRDVVNADANHCPDAQGRPGPACYSKGGLMRAVLPDGTPDGLEIWGKTGSRPGYVNGLFATRDRSRRLTYSFGWSGRPGKSELPYVLRTTGAAFVGAAKP